MDHPNMMCRTVFISGTGRSGTNILKEIFGKHPQVATLPFETRLTVDPRGLVSFLNSFISTWSPYQVDFLINDLEKFLLSLAERSTDAIPYQDWELSKWVPDYVQSVTELMDELRSFHYNGSWPGAGNTRDGYVLSYSGPMTLNQLAPKLGTFLIKLHRSVCTLQQRSVFVDDNTHSILFANELRLMLPTSKLIHVVRDPRDVICSLVHQNWTPGTLNQCTQWYKHVVHKWTEQAKLLPNEYYTVVKLEDIIETPQAMLAQLCGSIELPFCQEMLSVPLNTESQARFIKELTTEQLAFVERETKQEAKAFGYSY